MNRIDRLTGTILLLQSHRAITAEQIASHWEISLRTVYRDLAALTEAGVPLWFCPDHKGYRLMDGFHLPPVQFTDQEATALFVAGAVTNTIADTSLQQAHASALLKIRAVLPADRQSLLESLPSTVSILSWQTPNAAQPASFMQVQDAILRNQCISLTYDTAGQGTHSHRTVEPLGLLHYSDQWHLIAHCRLRNAIRDFRLDRIINIAVLTDTFQPPADFSLQLYLTQAYADRVFIPLTLTLPQCQLETLRRTLFGNLTYQEPLPNGRCRVELLVDDGPWMVNWLLGFGAELEVEAPSSVREAMAEAAAGIVGRYLG